MNIITKQTIQMESDPERTETVSIDLTIIGDDKEVWYSDFGFQVKVWDEEFSGIGKDLPIGAIVCDLEDNFCPNPAVVIEQSKHPAGMHYIDRIRKTVYEANEGRYPSYDDVYIVQFLTDLLNGYEKVYAYPSNRLGVIEYPYRWAEDTWPSGLYKDIMITLQDGMSEVNELFGTYPNGELVRQDNGTIQ